MSSQHLHGGLIFCIFFSCRLAMAIDPSQSPLDMPPAGADSSLQSQSQVPSMQFPAAPVALPAGPVAGPTIPADTSTVRKFYTISASLRETYDDNVDTTAHKVSALETNLSPSLLLDFPVLGSDFSARYTFGLTYYSRGGQGGISAGNNGGSIDLNHEFVARYSHSFSDRFEFDISEQFRYFSEPSLYESTGTPFRDGNYVSNAITTDFNAQWTPLFSTTTTFADTVIKYDEAAVAQQENSVENTGSHSFNFAILPKVTASIGGLLDTITYDTADRGYTNYTLFVGGQWQTLPSLSISLRGGGSYTLASQQKGSTSPYAAADVRWSFGQRSLLTFSYAHDVVPSDQEGTDGQLADRFSGDFTYAVTPSLSAHLLGTLTMSQIGEQLIVGSDIPAYNETDYALDVGASYQYNSFLGFDGGIIISGVSSGLNERDYDRQEVYLGLRGTY
jgi:hypothetical protein